MNSPHIANVAQRSCEAIWTAHVVTSFGICPPGYSGKVIKRRYTEVELLLDGEPHHDQADRCLIVWIDIRSGRVLFTKNLKILPAFAVRIALIRLTGRVPFVFPRARFADRTRFETVGPRSWTIRRKAKRHSLTS